MLSIANKPVMLSVVMPNVVIQNAVASGPILGTFLVAECHFLYVGRFTVSCLETLYYFFTLK
jgi:hypothetical protein